MVRLILVEIESVSIIGKVSDYEFFLLVDADIFIFFQVCIFMVKRDRS